MGWRDTITSEDSVAPKKKSWRDTISAEPTTVEESGSPAFLDTVAATAEGAGDVLSFGYAPQIKAGLAKAAGAVTPFTSQQVLAAFDKPIGEVVSGEAFEGLPEEEMSYVQLRDEAIKRGKGVQEADPTGYGLGMGAGILATIPKAATTAIAKLGSQGVKAALPSLAKATAIGAGQGAVYNPGDTEGVIDPIQAKERGVNALIGGAFGVGGELLPGLASKTGKALSAGANSLAAKALGRSTKAFKAKLGDKGMQDIGKAALDSGIVSVIPKTVRQLDDAVAKGRNIVGEKIGKIVDDIEDFENKARASGAQVGVSKEAVVKKVRDELLDPQSYPSPEFTEQVEKRLASFLATGDDAAILPTKGAHISKKKLGNSMQQKGAWARIKKGEPTETDLISLKLYDALSEGVIDSATAIGELMPSKAIKESVRDLNKKYSVLQNMQKITRDEINAGNTNNLLNLTSIIAATGAGSGAAAGGEDAVGSLTTAALVGGGLQAAKRFGPQIGAKVAQGLSKVAEGAAKLPKADYGKLALQSRNDFIQTSADNKLGLNEPTPGAKALKLDGYSDKATVEVYPDEAAQIKEKLKTSGLTNSEKAMVLYYLDKQGKVSPEVLQLFKGSK